MSKLRAAMCSSGGGGIFELRVRKRVLTYHYREYWGEYGTEFRARKMRCLLCIATKISVAGLRSFYNSLTL